MPSVDLSRYAGLWYEFARLPNKFEDTKSKTCSFVTAEYTLRKDGRVGVLNRCRIQSGKIEVAKGIARVTDKRTRGLKSTSHRDSSGFCHSSAVITTSLSLRPTIPML